MPTYTNPRMRKRDSDYVTGQIHFERLTPITIPAEVLEDRDRRRGAIQSVTAEIMGDPAPGQSALDQKRAAAR